MRSTYDSGFSRDAKREAFQAIIDEWKERFPREYVHVGVFNPSTTCLDLDVMVENGLIRDDTCLVFFENGKYLRGEDRNDYRFVENVMSHVPMVRRENAFFHFGELETLQLGGVLSEMGRNEVDFMFLDLCGELHGSHARWLRDNRSLVRDGSFQFYTISIQSGMRIDGFTISDGSSSRFSSVCSARGFMRSQYLSPEPSRGYRMELVRNGGRNRHTDRLETCADYWHFICSHVLDTSVSRGDDFPVMVYQGGAANTTKMGIFHGRAGRIEGNRWDYDMGFLCDGIGSIGTGDGADGVKWSDASRGKRSYRPHEVRLFRDMPIDFDESHHRYQMMMDYIIRGESPRRRSYDRVTTHAVEVFPTMFPPETRDDRYRCSVLTHRRGEELLDRFMVGKRFRDGVDGREYLFVRNGSKYDFIEC